jgi:hypothetical protein
MTAGLVIALLLDCARKSFVGVGSDTKRKVKLLLGGLRGMGLSGTLVGMALSLVGHSSAFAQGKLDARYSVTLAGVSIGRGSWVINIGEDQFSAVANGTTAGLARVFASGQGYSSVHGTVAAGQLAPAVYVSSIRTGQEEYEVRMVFSGSNVTDFAAHPSNTPSPDRIPLTQVDREGVSDPMTGSLVWVPGNGDTVAPHACERTVSIFEGHMRYDLQLAFRRIERVKSQVGYEGPAVVCSVHFEPIAGHIPDRFAIRYLTELRGIELSLAPIAGTRVLAPYRFSMPTPIGIGIMQADQFVSTLQ